MIHRPDFDSLKQTNVYGIEYWSARDLMPLLGYGKNWQNFSTAIQKAMTSCQENGQIVDHHFNASIKMVQIGSGAQREVDDYSLSRLACYLIAMNGNPRKVEIAAAQNYFAVSTRTHEIHQLREEQERRLEMRLKVSDSYKQLANAAQQSGVNSKTFGLFIDAGYMGLHHHTVEDLKTRKGIPEHEDYLDNIGREELSAIDFKNVLTEGKLVEDQVDGLENAMQTHYFAESEVRKAVEAIHRRMPEDLPTAPSIRKLVEARRRVAKKRKLKTTKQSQQPSLLGDSSNNLEQGSQESLFDDPGSSDSHLPIPPSSQ